MFKPTSIDIFCRVIDNYGDIGICWRLARDLQRRYQVAIRLLIDDLNAFKKICPEAKISSIQHLHGIFVEHWEPKWKTEYAAQWVIEAFACELPEFYLNLMQGHTTCWLNLEYLSAEDWVEGCHLLASPQPNKVPKFFFFPGFTQSTGGLIREEELLVNFDNYKNLECYPQLWNSLQYYKNQGYCIAFLFCYANAPIHRLISILKQQEEKWCLLIPDGVADSIQSDEIEIIKMPFIAQDHLDSLLRFCDLNLVRGEDTWIRAIWARKPFLWQIYVQEDGAHEKKLKAWLKQGQWPASVEKCFLAWNNFSLSDEDSLEKHLTKLLATATEKDQWKNCCDSYANSLTQETSLSERLWFFACQQSK